MTRRWADGANPPDYGVGVSGAYSVSMCVPIMYDAPDVLPSYNLVLETGQSMARIHEHPAIPSLPRIAISIP